MVFSRTLLLAVRPFELNGQVSRIEVRTWDNRYVHVSRNLILRGRYISFEISDNHPLIEQTRTKYPLGGDITLIAQPES